MTITAPTTLATVMIIMKTLPLLMAWADWEAAALVAARAAVTNPATSSPS